MYHSVSVFEKIKLLMIWNEEYCRKNVKLQWMHIVGGSRKCLGSVNHFIYMFALLHVMVIMQNSLGLIFSMIILISGRWMHLFRVFRAVWFCCFSDFETEINVVFSKFSQPEKKCTVVHNWYRCLAIWTELTEQKLQPWSLRIFM